jgi:hypothetical protein
MDQDRLFRLPPEAVSVTASYAWPFGWRVTVGVRRADEGWHEARMETYEHLSTEELLQVIDADLTAGLGL